jgi:hypothetical protein
LTGPDPVPERRAFHKEGEAVVFETPKTEEETAREDRANEQHEFARAQVETNKQMVRLTGALVIATFLTISVGIWQAVISREAANAARDAAQTASNTLGEMQRGQGAQDTHTLAQQAVTQATQTTNLANDTHDLADQARNQANKTGVIASETKRQLDDFESSERAVLQVTVELDPDKRRISASVKNVGKTAATNISYPGGPRERECIGGSSPIPLSETGYERLHSDPSGFTLGPGEPPYLLWSQNFTIEDEDALMARRRCLYFTPAIGFKDFLGKEQTYLACFHYLKGHFPACYFSSDTNAVFPNSKQSK